MDEKKDAPEVKVRGRDSTETSTKSATPNRAPSNGSRGSSNGGSLVKEWAEISAVVAALLYAIGRLFTDVFYDKYGLTPEDVGMDVPYLALRVLPLAALFGLMLILFLAGGAIAAELIFDLARSGPKLWGESKQLMKKIGRLNVLLRLLSFLAFLGAITLVVALLLDLNKELAVLAT